MAYNRAELRALVRQRLGWPSDDTFVTDAELNNYINDSLLELSDLLSTMHGSTWMAEAATFSTVAGTAQYDTAVEIGAVPGSIARILRIDCDLGGGSLVPFRRGDIATHIFHTSASGWGLGGEITYFIIWQGSLPPNIRFDPTPQAAHTVTVWYQEPEALLDDDIGDNPLGHDEYLIIDCCIKCRTKEESDTSDLVAQKTAYQARMERLSRPLDVGQPPTVADTRSAFGVAREESWWHRR